MYLHDENYAYIPKDLLRFLSCVVFPMNSTLDFVD